MPESPTTAGLLLAVAAAACAAVDSPAPRSKQHPAGALVRAAHRAGPDLRIEPGELMRMKAQRDALLAAGALGPAPQGAGALTNWQWLGPGNVGGRLRGHLIHPTNPATMWVGSAGGGVWKTTDAGASWLPLNDYLPILAVGCMAMDPADPDVIYVGTGENGYFDTAQGSSNLAVMTGAGVFKSTDGGTSFSQLASTAGWLSVSRLAIDPNDGQTLLAGTPEGIFRSTDGGTSWTMTSSLPAMDVDFHPSLSSRAVAGTDDVALWSGDGGLTWQTATGLPSAAVTDRVELAYAPSDPTTVYVALSEGDIEIWRSTDGGQSYSSRYTGNAIGTYSKYNNTIWVDPTDSDTVVVGGVYPYRSTTGGTSPSSITGGIHPDLHWFLEHPDYDGVTNRTVYCATDAGLWVTTDIQAGSVTWTDLNNNMGITQFYGAAINDSSGVVLGGTQDNGSQRYQGATDTWLHMFGGDGGFAASDPTDPNYFYGESQNLAIFRSTNGGLSGSYIHSSGPNPIVEPDPNFIPPFILDPNDPLRMLAGGAELWRTSDVKASTVRWSSIKPALSCTSDVHEHHEDEVDGLFVSHFALDPPCNISAITVEPGNPDVIWVGHNNGQLFKTTNGTVASPAWSEVDPLDLVLPNRFVGRIAVDPLDTDRVYAGFYGYTPDNLWLTEDGGTTWTEVTGAGATGLPDAPVTSVAVSRTTPGVVYAGTDVGVFWSGDDGASWATNSLGAGVAPVEELVWRNDVELLVVTHGRGIYLADSSSGPLTYCTAKQNSCGTFPAISGSGRPSATAGSGFTVSASNVKANKLGILMYTGAGPASQPFMGGTLCIATPAPEALGATDLDRHPGPVRRHALDRHERLRRRRAGGQPR